MVTGERAFQVVGLLFMENQCQVVQNSLKLDDLMESMGKSRELRHTVTAQEQTISSLTDRLMRLERCRRDRRGLGSLLSQGSGPLVYRSTWSRSGTRELPIVETQVQVDYLKPVSNSEGEGEIHVVENPVPVPVHPPTPSPAHPSLAKHLGVNYNLWRNNGGTSDGDQSGSEG